MVEVTSGAQFLALVLKFEGLVERDMVEVTRGAEFLAVVMEIANSLRVAVPFGTLKRVADLKVTV